MAFTRTALGDCGQSPLPVRRARYWFAEVDLLISTWPVSTLWWHAYRVRAWQPHGCLYKLLNHFFNLSPEHSSVVAIKGYMKPIPFFALDDEFRRVAKI